ncbi:MAG: signal peptidase I [Clostridia bacterium]|nr:signal peptidase I [Clostridia bacterium]
MRNTVILLMLPLAVLRVLDCEVYSVISGSMEPSVPVNSLVVVRHADPLEISAGDVIAFRAGDTVIIHRVVTNLRETHELTTKGDANTREDLGKVMYRDVIGKAVFHINDMGLFFEYLSGTKGKIFLAIPATTGVILCTFSSFMGKTEKENDTEQHDPV